MFSQLSQNQEMLGLDVWGNLADEKSNIGQKKAKPKLDIVVKEEDINEFYNNVATDKAIQDKITSLISTYSQFNNIKDKDMINDIVNDCIMFAMDNNCKSENEFWDIVEKNRHMIAKRIKNNYEIYNSDYIYNDHTEIASTINSEYEMIESQIDNEIFECNRENSKDYNQCELQLTDCEKLEKIVVTENDEITQANHLINDIYGKVTQRQAEVIKAILLFLDLQDKNGSTKKPTQSAIAAFVTEITGKHITRQSLNLIIIRLTTRINKALLDLVGTKGEYAKHIKQSLDRLNKSTKNKTTNVIPMQEITKRIQKNKKQKPCLYPDINTTKILSFGNFISQQAYNYYKQLKALLAQRKENNVENAVNVNNTKATGLSANKPVATNLKTYATTISDNAKANSKLNIVKNTQISNSTHNFNNNSSFNDKRNNAPKDLTQTAIAKGNLLFGSFAYQNKAISTKTTERINPHIENYIIEPEFTNTA